MIISTAYIQMHGQPSDLQWSPSLNGRLQTNTTSIRNLQLPTSPKMATCPQG